MVGGRRLASALTSCIVVAVAGRASHFGGAAVAADMKPLIKAPPPSGTFKLHLFRVGASWRF
jgi:phosphoribosylcarboxyaminoimidazole (NCAIR) mutase